MRNGSESRESQIPLSLYSLALGTFALGTTELVIVGLLPEVSGDLGVSVPTAGLLVTGFALAVVVGGPALTLATVKMPRKMLLLALMGVFVLGNIVCALSPTYSVLMAGRLVAALGFGAFFGVANVVAVGIVREERHGTALGLLASGLTVSTVVGVPFGTFVGQQLGWRAAFWLVAALGVLAFLSIATLVPRDGGGDVPDLRSEISALLRPQVLVCLAMTALGFGGVFTSFTYIAPMLRDVSGYSGGGVAVLLVVFGVGSVVGTTVGGRLADLEGSIDRVLLGSFIALTVTLGVFAVTVGSQVGAAVTIFVFGVAGYLAVPGLAARIVEKASDAPTLSSTANISAFSVANAGGAFIGGAVISGGFGLIAVNWVGAAIAVLGAVVAAIALLTTSR